MSVSPRPLATGAPAAQGGSAAGLHLRRLVLAAMFAAIYAAGAALPSARGRA